MLASDRGAEWADPLSPLLPNLYRDGNQSTQPIPLRQVRGTMKHILERISASPAGTATAAFIGGASELYIARHGRWKDGSGALTGYIRRAETFQEIPAGKTGL